MKINEIYTFFVNLIGKIFDNIPVVQYVVFMDTKDKITIEALKIFISHGYSGTSISMISERCGLTKGAIYHHFKNKDDLFYAGIDYYYRDFDDWLNQRFAQAKNLKDFILIFFDHIDYLSKIDMSIGEAISFFVFMNDAKKHLPGFDEILIKKYREYIKEIERRLIEAKKEKLISQKIDCKALALHIYMLFEGIMLMFTMTNDISIVKKISKKIYENLWDMMQNSSIEIK